MKRLLTFAALLPLFLFSCTKEEENPVSQLEDIQFVFANQDEDLVQIPEGLANSEFGYASLAQGWLQYANNLTSTYAALFEIPGNAVKTSQPINAANARITGGAEYLVYKWEYGGNGFAYQIHQDGSKYVLEILTKSEGSDWMLYLYVEQDAEGKNGLLRAYESEQIGGLVWVYTWQTVGDILKINFGTSETVPTVKLEVNNQTGAGWMEYYNEGSREYKIQWNADGSGSWTCYYTDGTESGSWSAS